MKHVHAFRKSPDRQPEPQAAPATLFFRLSRLCAAAMLLLAFTLAAPAWSQTHEAGTGGGLSISAGAMASGYYLGYGERKILGYTAFVDADTRSRIGVEAEGRWLRYEKVANPTNKVNAATYLIGGRYHMDFRRNVRLYGKGMVGIGQFTFPYSTGHGNYLVIAPGAGVDYHLFNRYFWRVDTEYQFWPQFTFGSMSSFGVSTGIHIRLF